MVAACMQATSPPKLAMQPKIVRWRVEELHSRDHGLQYGVPLLRRQLDVLKSDLQQSMEQLLQSAEVRDEKMVAVFSEQHEATTTQLRSFMDNKVQDLNDKVQTLNDKMDDKVQALDEKVHASHCSKCTSP